MYHHKETKGVGSELSNGNQTNLGKVLERDNMKLSCGGLMKD